MKKYLIMLALGMVAAAAYEQNVLGIRAAVNKAKAPSA